MPEWADVRIGELLRVTHGWPFKSDHYAPPVGARPIVVAIGNFEYTGGFRFERSTVKAYAGEYPSEFECIPGDIMLVMTCQTEGGEILGVPGRIPNDGMTYLHNQRIGRVVIERPDVLDPDFFYQYARTRAFNRQLVVTASGSKILHTSPSRISDATIPIPLLSEQRAIAEVLGALDDKIAANTRLAVTADDLAQVLYGDHVRRLPRVAMSSLLSPILGGTPARSRAEFWDGTELWISAKDITGAAHHVVLDTEQTITDLAVRRTKAKPLPRGSVILTARGTVGAVARLGMPASFNQSCYGFEPVALPPSVLYFAVLAATDQAKAIAHGSVFDTITMKTFDHLTVPEFGVGDAATLEAKLAPLLESVEAAEIENRQLAAVRDTLLPQLMSGKLRVREAAEMAGL